MGLLFPAVLAGVVLLAFAAPVGAGVSAAVQSVEMGAAAPLEQRLSRGTRDSLRAVRRYGRRSLYLIRYSLLYWWKLVRRGLVFVAWALLAGTVDRRLLEAWRRDGLPALRASVPPLLYVQVGLLADRRADRIGWWLLAGAIAYGVWWHDLVPDRHLVPGWLDDLVLVGAAMRLFLARCPAGVVEAHAARALAWQRRAEALRGARRPGTGISRPGRPGNGS